GYGVTGIANGASFGVQSVADDNVADAINTAAAQLSAGDIINIEFQFFGPSSGTTCPCNCPPYEMVPGGWENAEFDAIQSATSASVIVTEPAGNGGMDLDDARYKSAFDRTKRFSGAIMVGAGTASNGAPECFTNYGSRVDLHGWGDGVTTL